MVKKFNLGLFLLNLSLIGFFYYLHLYGLKEHTNDISKPFWKVVVFYVILRSSLDRKSGD